MLITALIRSISYALQIWAVNARYNLTRRISNDIIADTDQIERLRARGGPADQLAADRLRDRVVAAQGIAIPEPLATVGAPAGRRPDRADA